MTPPKGTISDAKKIRSSNHKLPKLIIYLEMKIDESLEIHFS